MSVWARVPRFLTPAFLAASGTAFLWTSTLEWSGLPLWTGLLLAGLIASLPLLRTPRFTPSQGMLLGCGLGFTLYTGRFGWGIFQVVALGQIGLCAWVWLWAKPAQARGVFIVLILATCVSALVSLAQYHMGVFLGVWEIARGEAVKPAAAWLTTSRISPAGLADFSVSLAGQAILASGAGMFVGNRWTRLAAFGVLVFAMGSVGSRAGFVGISVGIVAALFVLRQPRWAVLSGLALVTLYLSLGLAFSNHLMDWGDKATLSRIGQAQGALAVFSENPLGVGELDYRASLDAAAPAGTLVIDSWARDFLPHNQMVLALGLYGLPGLFLSLGFFGSLTYMVARSEGPRTIRAGRWAIWFGYVVFAATHSSGPLFGDTIVWYYIALSFIPEVRAKVPSVQPSRETRTLTHGKGEAVPMPALVKSARESARGNAQ